VGTRVVPRRSGERGSALLLVLAVVAVLSLIAGAVVRSGGLERRIAANAEEAARARALADAGILLGIQALLTPERREGIRLDGRPFDVEFGDKQIKVSAQDQAGLIDLNTGSLQSIAAVLMSAGLAEQDAAMVATRIADWRDADSQTREGGAERPDYEKAGRQVLPRDAPIEEVDEIASVLGMQAPVLAAVRDHLTVFSGRSEPDPDLAPAALSWTADAFSNRASLRTSNSAPSGAALPLAGKVVAFRAEAPTARGSRSARRAVVRFTGDPARPYLVQDWRSD
jgi:general secretion pathway protein K